MKRKSDGTIERESAQLDSQEVARLRQQVDALTRINAGLAETMRRMEAQQDAEIAGRTEEAQP